MDPSSCSSSTGRESFLRRARLARRVLRRLSARTEAVAILQQSIGQKWLKSIEFAMPGPSDGRGGYLTPHDDRLPRTGGLTAGVSNLTAFASLARGIALDDDRGSTKRAARP